MALTQYIGARYVPKFFEGSDGSAWEQGISYEPLTIVTYLGSSWTSKKQVPYTVGAPNLNPQYWVNTGNFNEQVHGIEEELTDIRGDISDLGDALGIINTLATDSALDLQAIEGSPVSLVGAIYQGDIISVDY